MARLRRGVLSQWHQCIVAALLLDAEEPESLLPTELVGVYS